MSTLFSKNAYNLLGLDTSSSQKKINKRVNEITNLLRIDESPEYETDSDLCVAKRDEESVKAALQKLNSPIKRIKEYFFWFDIQDQDDEEALKLLSNNKYIEAAELWKTREEKNSISSFIAKRNLAILSSLILFNNGQNKYLTMSIKLWEEIIESDKFWDHFEKVYSLNDEVGTDESAIQSFRLNVSSVLSDFYTDVSKKHKDNTYYAHFSKTFGIKGGKMQNEVLDPIYEKINDTAEKLKNLNISDDNVVSHEEILTLRRLSKILQDKFQELKDLGLYEDSQTKIMRDKSAEAIRIVAVDLFNNLNETQRPLALMKVALGIAGTIDQRNRINIDINTTRQRIKYDKLFEPINKYIQEEKFSIALQLILDNGDKYKHDKNITDFFKTRTQWCVTAIAVDDLKTSHNYLNKGDYDNATRWFASTFEFVEPYLDDFGINKEWLYQNIQLINQTLSVINKDTLQNAESLRNKIIEASNEAFKDTFEHSIVVTLIDCTLYGKLSEKMPSIKRANAAKSVGRTILTWVIWLIVIGVIAAIGQAMRGGSSSNTDSTSSPSSSSSPQYTACIAEYNSLKSQLDSIESRMDSYKASNDVENFNTLVPEQNQLVSEANAKSAECQGL